MFYINIIITLLHIVNTNIIFYILFVGNTRFVLYNYEKYVIIAVCSFCKERNVFSCMR